jgi:hypothetical protein
LTKIFHFLAVQHSRDGIGKRKEPEKRSSIDSAPVIKAPKPLEMIIQSPTSSTSISDYTPPDTVLSSTYWSPPPLSTSNNTIFMPLDSFTASFPSTYGTSVSPQNLVLNGTLTSNLENKPGNMPHIVHNFANLVSFNKLYNNFQRAGHENGKNFRDSEKLPFSLNYQNS